MRTCCWGLSVRSEEEGGLRREREEEPDKTKEKKEWALKQTVCRMYEARESPSGQTDKKTPRQG